MKQLVKLDQYGSILYSASFAIVDDADPSLVEIDLPDNESFADLWVDNGTVRRKPIRPSEYHIWVDGQWVADLPMASSAMRTKRDSLLSGSDWTQVSDSSCANAAEWRDYRSKLRSITDQPGFPLAVTWPVPPDKLHK